MPKAIFVIALTLLPPTSKTVWLPTKSTFPPNICFMSWGFLNSAPSISFIHLSKALRLVGCFCLNSSMMFLPRSCTPTNIAKWHTLSQAQNIAKWHTYLDSVFLEICTSTEPSVFNHVFNQLPYLFCTNLRHFFFIFSSRRTQAA